MVVIATYLAIEVYECVFNQHQTQVAVLSEAWCPTFSQ